MRKIVRNVMRNKVGNSGLQELFQTYQIKKYGLNKLDILHKKCKTGKKFYRTKDAIDKNIRESKKVLKGEIK